MRLSAIPLKNYCDVNSWDYTQNFQYNEGSNARMYLQLIDLDREICDCSDGSFYQRYVATAPASLQVEIQNLDETKTISLTAMQVAEDKSLWYVDLLPTYKIGSANIHLTLTEPSGVKKGVVVEGIKVNPTSPGSISFC